MVVASALMVAPSALMSVLWGALKGGPSHVTGRSSLTVGALVGLVVALVGRLYWLVRWSQEMEFRDSVIP